MENESVTGPPEGIRGDIARTYQHMDSAYPEHGTIGNRNEQLDMCTGCAYNIVMNFQWDKNKAKSNLDKHGIDFADAVSVFDDLNAITIMILIRKNNAL